MVSVIRSTVFSTGCSSLLYGGANVSYTIAKKGELPRIFERKVWGKSSIISCFVSLGVLIYYEIEHSPLSVIVLAAAVLLSFVAEGAYRKFSLRLLKTRT